MHTGRGGVYHGWNHRNRHCYRTRSLFEEGKQSNAARRHPLELGTLGFERFVMPARLNPPMIKEHDLVTARHR